MDAVKKCFCGRELHYSNKELERIMVDICETKGDYLEVSDIVNYKTYRVQRHYIALHGIKQELLPTYGFEELN